MNKKAFTLVEIILSIFLFSIIMMFLFKATSNLQHNNKNFKTSIDKDTNQEKIISLLKKDLIMSNSKSFKMDNKDKEKSIITFQTNSSIYNISKPYVTWKVLKNSKRLVRVESSQKHSKDNESYHIDIIKDNCKLFKIYKGKNGYLIYIKDSINKEIIAEVKSAI